ncbi:hypothetical protein P879_02512 [Paragonimus westermani]|uniref:Uncharacterized protein n=1 Tax=Paragonimus westermani TaxID=34504 RepID=A0A8T0DKM0_9TREM|nr:hypothetical protein P879_02512 [Paragonimus westermani]
MSAALTDWSRTEICSLHQLTRHFSGRQDFKKAPSRREICDELSRILFCLN